MPRHFVRTRWAATGAVVAVCLGAGGVGIGAATTSSGERAVFQPIEPCRLADTRPAPDTVGNRTTPLGPDETYTLLGWGDVGNCSLPTDTAGLALNVTAVDPTSLTFLTLFPADSELPLASHLNPAPGEPPTPNAVTVDLDPAGRFSVYNLQGNVHVIVDVVGHYHDHDHDDRYYTQADVDAAVDAAKPIARYRQGRSAWVLESPTSVPLGGTFSFALRTVTIDAPSPGTIVANGSLWAEDHDGGGGIEAACGLSTAQDLTGGDRNVFTLGDHEAKVIAVTRSFDVVDAESVTIRLLCRTYPISVIPPQPTAMQVHNWTLTAIFVPD
ncbi:MAG: hypothetical protein QNJ12_19130 [Ilumatobacter sp.]|uniref:hypothetical protein n=1 Tax=Ilumatobacter sp. TaxID=1967498 RepID=UPI00260A92FC|nr:hypothetical protein [Ilumatobacter sp.]MDJ0770915.1 hypothetical protein [Ilumatobacter sp.]